MSGLAASTASSVELSGLPFLKDPESYFEPGAQSLGPLELLRLAKDRSPQGRALLASTVSEFLNGEPSQREQTLIADILLQLVRDAELDMRRALAERLARNPNAPHELMLFLAHDDIAVARPVLVLSQVLEDDDLVNVIRQRSTYHRRAIARRPALSDAVQETLVLSNDVTALTTMLDNNDILLSQKVLTMMAEAARHKEPLRASLIKRPEMTHDFAIKLYWWLSLELRHYMLKRFQLSRVEVDRALEGTLQSMIDSRFEMSAVTMEMLDVAKNLAEAGKVSSGLLIQILRRGQIIPFVALLSQYLKLPVFAIETMVLAHDGETMALAAKAANIAKPDFASIFLLSRAGRPGEKVVDPRELSRALEFYDKLPQTLATRVLEIWQGNTELLRLDNFDLFNQIMIANQGQAA